MKERSKTERSFFYYAYTNLLSKYNLYKLIINKIFLHFRLFWYRFGINIKDNK
jgi:hypothetical protein